MTFQRTITDEEFERRKTEMESLGREIHNLLRKLQELRRRHGILYFSVHRTIRRREQGRTEHERKLDAAASRRYRKNLKERRKADLYMGRRYDDVQEAA